MKLPRLDDRPSLQPVGLQTDPVDRLLVRRVSVQPFPPHGLVKAVEFAGNRKSEFPLNYPVSLISRRFISRNHLP